MTAAETMSPLWPQTFANNRRWLRRRGLMDRPWFILASAPAPTIPDRLGPSTAFIYVKYAGFSARKRGLPDGDLTMLLKKTRPEQVKDLNLKSVLRLGGYGKQRMRVARALSSVGYRECKLDYDGRDDFILAAVGSLFAGAEDRPSNGVALLCYAIALGVPHIIVAGISLERDGHDYSDTVRKRRHVEEDTFALRRIAETCPHVYTTEEGLHRLTGLPLYVEEDKHIGVLPRLHDARHP